MRKLKSGGSGVDRRMGSSVAYGRARAVVVAVGMQTEMGKIANVLAEAKEEKPPLQIKMSQLSKVLTYMVLGICVVMFGSNLIRDGLAFDTIMHSLMVAIGLAVEAIPEGLATTVTIVLSLGVTNMSKKNAVIRKLTAVETLGCAEIICSDKTGTYAKQNDGCGRLRHGYSNACSSNGALLGRSTYRR